jgi:uncharacterized protein YodC (DUF2158 family)
VSNSGSWKVGDQVQLNSGGPVMTVQQVLSTGSDYRCQWFAGKKLESGTFPGVSLIVPKPSPQQGNP